MAPGEARDMIIRPLTAQQERVVDALCRGLGNRAIAKTMAISPSTVKGHIIAIDNIFVGPRDPEITKRERIRIWGLFRQWDTTRPVPLDASKESYR
jgi:FixJ family two-component response regulator